MIVNPMDNIGSYISTQGVPTSIISRDGNYSTAYSATIPMGINPQSLYIQNPASVTGFQNTTGHQFASAHNFSLVPQNVMPNPIHIKTRVYVPNQIVGILIGTKGQTIKSVIAECGAIIRIEGDRDSTPSSSSVHQNANNSVAASQENSYNNNKSTTTCVEDPSVISSVNSCDHLQETGDNTSNGPIVAPAVDSLGTCETTTTCQINGGHKKNSVVTGHPPSPDQRGVFISGYDFQVSRALFWVFRKVAESQNMRADDLVLTCEAIVPNKVVGRIIGKNGANIKVPEDLNQQDKNSVEAAVRVVGNFYAVQMVQHHFGTLILDTEWRESREYVEKQSGFRRNVVAYDQLSSHLEYPEKQYYSSQGMIVNPLDNIGQYISAQGVPAYSSAYSATIPMGINPQSHYIQNPASVTGFQNTTGHQFASAHNFSLVPQNVMPNPIHIKTRVYVPNQIVGILIGTKGQTIKSVIAECGAIIRIEGDRDSTPSSSSVHQNANNSVAASQENSYNNNKSTTTCVEDPSVISSVNSCDHLQETGDNTSNGPIVAPAVDSLGTCETTTTCQINGGHKKNSVVTGHPPSPDQRGVFISGYDFQVSRALFWVFRKVAESQNMRADDLVLTCEAIVPNKVVGRIIGKNGANIKVPEDLNQQDKNSVEAAVRVVGNFYAVQMVQHHFGTLILDTEWRESREYVEKRSRFREGGSR
uniref:KH domain-containing protein n=1 Tax=Meloidogyne hapla TaxID=6305 RepID=A0A1I8BUR9_MELHA